MITKHTTITVPHQVTVDLGPYPDESTDWSAMARLAEAEASVQCAGCFGDRGPSARSLHRYRFTPIDAPEGTHPSLLVNVLVTAAGR